MLSVIIFHINAKWIPGGFLGVDIFFVISGYLITLILAKEVTSTGKINIINFYKRRIKRIIPALLFVLIATFITGFLIFTPDALLGLSKSMIWSFFSAANIYFFSSIDTGYFATGSTELPLLHLWSLGVEEQFYILWPFIVLYLVKYIYSIKKQIFIVSIIFISSLLLAQSIIATDHSFAYYMLFTRAWELLAGAIVALMVHAGYRVKNIISELMAFVGFLLIILSLAYVSESDPVPGMAAIPVIIGVSLLILSGVSQRTYIGRVLSFRLFVAIGLVSYSAYLWHWPVLAFLRYALVEIDLQISVYVIFFTFFMATISYFFIEKPLRQKNISTKSVFLWYFFIPSLIIIVISFITIQGIKNKSELIFSFKKLNQLEATTLPAYKYSYNCQYRLFDVKAYSDDRCIYPKNIEKANILLIGDSHAAHYLGMLRVFANYYGFSIRNATQSSCPIVFNNRFNWIDSNYKKGCYIYNDSLKEEVKKYDTIIIGGKWDSYYNKEGFIISFEKIIEFLSKNTKHVILLAKNPLFPGYNKDCEARNLRLNTLNCSTRFNNTKKHYIANNLLRHIATKYNNVNYFEVIQQLCKNNVCSPYIDGNPVYYDTHHFSMKGSEKIGKMMIETNDPFLSVFNHLRNIKPVYRTPILSIDSSDEFVDFIIRLKQKNIKVAFYLYKDNKRVDIQWYSNDLNYKLDKKKYGKGKYRIRYFIVDKNESNPSKAKKLEEGYSEYFKI